MSPRPRLFVALVSLVVAGYMTVGYLLGVAFGDNTYGQLSVFNEVVRLVIDAYVEPIDLERTMNGANRGLLEALDGDGAYLDPEQLRRYKDPASLGEAEIGVELSRRFGFLMVVATRPGSPAGEAGLRSGDILKSIDGRHSRPLGAPVGELLLRGEPGSEVELTILRAGIDPLEMTVSRERLVPAAPESRMVEDQAGYLKVAEFTDGTADQIRGELELLKRRGAERLILDLRGAAFGDPAHGAAVAALFVREGVLARRDGRKVAEQVWEAEPSQVAWTLPMAALIDTGTAGPGEVVAAALLQSERAALVGGHSFGRAGVQKLLPLPEGALVLTVAKYLAPDGTAIHGRGLAATVPVEEADSDAIDEAAEAAERDPALEKALEHLRESAEELAKAA